MEIIIIGNGMYATGRGTEEFGTVLPAVFKFCEKTVNSKISIVGTNSDHSKAAKEKVNELSKTLDQDVNVDFFPKNQLSNKNAYLDVIKKTKSIACAIIVVPDHLHYKITKDCLEAGLHCLVVKPLTLLTKDAIDLATIARKKQLYGAVEFHKRWDKSNLILRDVVGNHDIGDPLYSWVEYSQRKSIPTEVFKEWVSDSNVLNYLGVHYIDIMRFISGAKPLKVMAIGQKNWLSSKGYDSYDAVQCIIQWESKNKSKFTQTLLLNWIDPETSSAMSNQQIRIVGTNGRIEANQKDRGIEINLDESGILHPNPYFCRSFGSGSDKKTWEGYGIDSIVSFLQDVKALGDCSLTLKDLESSRPTFSEGVLSTAVLEAANISLNGDNLWVEVEYE